MSTQNKKLRRPRDQVLSKSRKQGGRLTNALRAALKKQIIALYVKGTPPVDIAAQLNIPQKDTERYLKQALDQLVTAFAKVSPQHTFVRYAAFQFEIIEKLQKSYDLFMKDDENKQYAAAVSSLKTQSDIYDKVMTKGVEYNVIERRKADRAAITSSGKNLRIELKQQITVLNKLLDSIDTKTHISKVRKRDPLDRYYVRIRKALRDDNGFVYAIPDWKYRTRITTTHDKRASSPSLTNKEKELVVTPQQEMKSYQKLYSKLLKEKKQPIQQ